MSTRLTGYLNNTIQADDTYILAMIDPQSKWTKAVISLTRIAAYNGVITVQSRPMGSSAAFTTQSYTTSAGASSVATLGAADTQIDIDATGKEIALSSTGRTAGSMTVNVGVQNEA
jgi:hypothetical protein